MHDLGNQIFVMVANIKHAPFMFKTMECCSKAHNIYCVHGKSIIQYQHQLEMAQEMTADLKVPKVDKSMSTRNSMQQWRALLIMATVVSTMALKSATFS